MHRLIYVFIHDNTLIIHASELAGNPKLIFRLDSKIYYLYALMDSYFWFDR